MIWKIKWNQQFNTYLSINCFLLLFSFPVYLIWFSLLFISILNLDFVFAQIVINLNKLVLIINSCGNDSYLLIKLIFLFILYHPTFTPIHCWSYSCGLKFSLKLEWYFFFIANNTWSTPPFLPPSFYPVIYISLYFLIILDNRSKILKLYDF